MQFQLRLGSQKCMLMRLQLLLLLWFMLLAATRNVLYNGTMTSQSIAYMPPELCFCSICAKRCVISSEVSMNRSTQLLRHVSVAWSSLVLGLPMHFSQQISLNSCI